MDFTRVLCWILVPLSAPFGFYLAFLISLFITDLIHSFCPAELVVSGLCTAKWYSRTVDGTIIFGAALAAVFVVMFPTLLAPEKRFEVAAAFYILGAVAMLLMAGGGRTFDLLSLLPIIAALVAGALTLLAVSWFPAE